MEKNQLPKKDSLLKSQDVFDYQQFAAKRHPKDSSDKQSVTSSLLSSDTPYISLDKKVEEAMPFDQAPFASLISPDWTGN